MKARKKPLLYRMRLQNAKIRNHTTRLCYYKPIENAFLKFAQEWDIKRIAYAASFGADQWEYDEKQTKEYLEDLLNNPSKLETMKNNVKEIAMPNATRDFVDFMKSLYEEEHN